MHQSVVLVGGNEEESREVCAVLKSKHCITLSLESLVNLETNIHKGHRYVIILDLDTPPVDNRSIRNLKKRNH